MPSSLNPLFFTLFLTFTQLQAKPTSNPLPKPQINTKVSTFTQKCNETCGVFQVSYPFYINNSSCGWSSPSNPPYYTSTFQLSCLNSTTLFLNIDSQNYRVLEFFQDGILVDFPGFSNTCRPYNDLNSFGFAQNNENNNCFGISNDNIIGLYDCEDSSLCKANCEANYLPNCNKNDNIINNKSNNNNNNNNDNGPTCCYPLNDDSVWKKGSNFGVFSKYECRGFASWVVPRGVKVGKRGVKLEWAIPIINNNNNNNNNKNNNKNMSSVSVSGSGSGICDVNAQVVNASSSTSSLKNGIRCFCDDGFVGDGYANGSGCFKACFKDGNEKFGKDCEPDKNPKRKIVILAVLTSTLAAVFLLTLACLLKRSVKPSVHKSNTNQPHFRSTLSFRKSCNTRLFTLKELTEATDGFDEGPVYKGTLKDGSGIAVQKIQCQNEHDLMQVLTRIELLSSIIHRQLAHIFGCCIDSGYTPMVIYEFPENGTLESVLQRGKDEKLGLDWYRRLSIAAQTASVLAFLQHEISPPIFHHDLRSSSIFLDLEYNVKVACFAMLEGGSNLYRSDVYDFGVILLEILSGSGRGAHALTQTQTGGDDLAAVGIGKIREGKIEEMVDPLLYFHEQPGFRREQIETVADIATRCLIFGGEGKFRMVDVARELVHIMKESIDGGSRRGPALEETFSNSSLLQMISMSPDSIYLPSKV